MTVGRRVSAAKKVSKTSVDLGKATRSLAKEEEVSVAGVNLIFLSKSMITSGWDKVV